MMCKKKNRYKKSKNISITNLFPHSVLRSRKSSLDPSETPVYYFTFFVCVFKTRTNQLSVKETGLVVFW